MRMRTQARSLPEAKIIVAAAAVLMLALPAPRTAAEPYVRAGLGIDWSAATTFRDRNCATVQPPALFGCGPGEDGRPLGARGDFGRSVSLDFGIGYRLLPFLRGEAAVSYRPGFRFSGNANFLRVTGPQPVAADLKTLTAMLAGFIDLPALGLPAFGPVAPFVGGGVGLARHDISRGEYRFPSLGANASTVIQGGTGTSFAFMLTGGAAVAVAERITLDLAYRYVDYGRVRTDAGPAVITRPTFVRVLDIAGTQARLTSHGLTASVRFGF